MRTITDLENAIEEMQIRLEAMELRQARVELSASGNELIDVYDEIDGIECVVFSVAEGDLEPSEAAKWFPAEIQPGVSISMTWDEDLILTATMRVSRGLRHWHSVRMIGTADDQLFVNIRPILDSMYQEGILEIEQKRLREGDEADGR